MPRSEGRSPGFFFFPGDWLRDPISRASLAAQGLLLRLLMLMHEGEPYGHLTTPTGKPIALETVAKTLGIRPQTVRKLMVELDDFGALSRTENGVLYSRKMVRDYDKSLQDKQNGQKGGNPNLLKGVNPSVNRGVKLQPSLPIDVVVVTGKPVPDWTTDQRERAERAICQYGVDPLDLEGWVAQYGIAAVAECWDIVSRGDPKHTRKWPGRLVAALRKRKPRATPPEGIAS